MHDQMKQSLGLSSYFYSFASSIKQNLNFLRGLSILLRVFHLCMMQDVMNDPMLVYFECESLKSHSSSSSVTNNGKRSDIR